MERKSDTLRHIIVKFQNTGHLLQKDEGEGKKSKSCKNCPE